MLINYIFFVLFLLLCKILKKEKVFFHLKFFQKKKKEIKVILKDFFHLYLMNDKDIYFNKYILSSL